MLQRHEDDIYAHPQALKPIWIEISGLKKFQYQVQGALIVVGAMIGGGILGIVGHLKGFW